MNSQLFAKRRSLSGPAKRQLLGPAEPYNCGKCQVTFTEKKSLNRHMRNIHCEDIVAGNQCCGICHKKFHTISQLHCHLENQHNVELKFSKYTFYTEADFLEWKKKVEVEDQASFVIRNKSISNGGSIFSYGCHRSGTYNPKENRSRHLKASGSVKIGSTCPAIIHVSSQTVDEISEINVNYQSIHVGHEKEVHKLPLTREDKQCIASALSQGVPMSKILEETRQKYSPTKRRGLVTRKDLHNIRRDFHIERTTLHENDATSVDLLVEKMKNDQYDPVLVYKPIGQVIADFPAISQNEFLLGIMNEPQQKLLELYNSCIMIDSTHGMSQYGFHLTTIMVIDEDHESVPVATLFSTKTATETILPFFSAIKERVPTMRTNVLISDDLFYNSWKCVFNDEAKNLLCSWHVSRRWNFNIHRKVKEKSNREKIRHELNTLLHETDLMTFQRLINNFICTYEESEKDFVCYFMNNYLKSPEKWAYCYRVDLGINSSMKVERLHQHLKYEESGGTVIKRLDKAIIVITSAIANKLLSRVILMERDTFTSKVSLIRKLHKSSSAMIDYNMVEVDKKIIVTKSLDGNIISYEIEKLDKNCNCPIRCEECNVCLHSMVCNCVDYSVHFIICEHIHYVCKNTNKVLLPNSHYASDENLSIDDDTDRNDWEEDIVTPSPPKKKRDITLRKFRVISKWQDLQKRIQICESESALLYAEEKLSAIDSYLDVCNIPKLSEIATAFPKKKHKNCTFMRKTSKRNRNID